MKVDRVTIWIGDLAGPLAEWCERHGKTQSEAFRIAMARMLRVEALEMQIGRPEIGELAADGAAASWNTKKKRARKKSVKKRGKK